MESVKFDEYGNPIVKNIKDAKHIEEVSKKYPKKAIHYKCTSVPSEEDLQNNGFQFLRYDQNENCMWFAKRNGSEMPWGPNHIIGGRLVLQFDDSFLLVKDKFGPQKFWFPGGTVQIDGELRDKCNPTTFKGHPLPHEIAIQELYEETGLDYRKSLEELKLVCQIFFKAILKHQGQIANDIAHFYLLRVKEKNDDFAIDDDEIIEIGWFTKDEILNSNDMTNVTKEIVKHVLNVEQKRIKKCDKYEMHFH